MSNPSPNQATRFQPGKSANPGAVPGDKELAAARKLTKQELDKTLNKHLFCSESELNALIKDPDASMLDKIVARILFLSHKKGDDRRLEFIINRLVGKVRENVSVDTRNVNVALPPPVVTPDNALATMSMAQLEELQGKMEALQSQIKENVLDHAKTPLYLDVAVAHGSDPPTDLPLEALRAKDHDPSLDDPPLADPEE